MNKREQAAYTAYKESTALGLSDVYGKYSYKKSSAWNRCVALMAEKGGRNLKIISHSIYFFTCGFEFEQDGKQMFM